MAQVCFEYCWPGYDSQGSTPGSRAERPTPTPTARGPGPRLAARSRARRVLKTQNCIHISLHGTRRLVIVDIVEGQVFLDEHQHLKQPDWTYDPVDPGKSPADRLSEHRIDS